MTTTVRAPGSGRVLRIPERSARVVAAGTPLLEIGDPESLEVVDGLRSGDSVVVVPTDALRDGMRVRAAP